MEKKLGIWYKNTKKSPNIQIAKMQMKTSLFLHRLLQYKNCPQRQKLGHCGYILWRGEEGKKLIPNSNDDATIWKLFKFAFEDFFLSFENFKMFV